MRHKVVTVEPAAEGTLKAHGILEDDMYGLELDLSIGLARMEIQEVRGRWNRWTTPECHRVIPTLQGALGFNILDAGFSDRVRREIGIRGCRHFANLMLECCSAVRTAAEHLGGDNALPVSGISPGGEAGAAPAPPGRGVAQAPAGAEVEDRSSSGGGTILDLHCHTSPASPCSSAEVGALIEEARGIGLDGICLTDHHTVWPRGDVEGLSRRYGFLVLRGNEITTDQGDILVFGLEEDIPGIIRLEVLREKVLDVGGFMIAAHPFRGFLVFGAGNLGLTPDRAIKRPIFRSIDAVETLNSKVTAGENALAARVAERLGLPATGGSDAHTVPEVGRCATRFPGGIRSEGDLIAALKKGGCEPIAYRRMRAENAS